MVFSLLCNAIISSVEVKFITKGVVIIFSCRESSHVPRERRAPSTYWDREILFNMGEESTTESSESEEIDDDDDDESPEDKDHLVRKIKFIFELKFSLLLPNLQMKTKQ